MKNGMKITTTNLIRAILFSSLALSVFPGTVSAAALFRTAAGANAAAIQATVDQFRTDLGALNPNTTQTFPSGRREINWDGVPDAFAAPNFFPSNFFNSNSPRGVIFGSPTSSIGNDTTNFLVSATAASGTAVRFGNIDPSYSTIFKTFSAERLFTVRNVSANSTVLSIQFFIPGTGIPAGVSGFGAVFCDVDSNTNAIVRVYGIDGRLLTTPLSVTAANNGLSFAGVSFNAGEKIARVEILSGNAPLLSGNIDGTSGVDVIAMDDFIYGEPHTIQYHPSDFDGDGTADLSVFRPSNGTWFVTNSGNNTFSFTPFGQNGDIPVEGDFDGDARSDIAVFRPSVGTWFRLNSSNGQFVATPFGQNGDRPVPGDYDKDGKTDVSVFRPSTGQWFILRSSDGAFVATQWGQNLDIPVPASAQ